MFICPPTPTHSELGFVEQTLFNTKHTAFSTSPAAKSARHVLTSLIPSSGLCLTALLSSSPAWACVLGLLMVTSFSSQAGPVAQSSAPCLSPAHSGSLRNSLALESLLGLQGVCSARAASLFVGLVLFLSFQGSLCLTVCVCIGKSGIALHSEPVFTNLTWSSRVWVFQYSCILHPDLCFSPSFAFGLKSGFV